MATNPTSPGGVANGDYITETWGDRADAYLLHVGPNRPRCFAYQTASKNYTASTTHAPAIDGAEDYDTDGYHSLVTNPSRFTIPASLGGVYQCGGRTYNVTATAPTSGGIFVGFRINGGSAIWQTSVPHAASFAIYASWSRPITLAAGDYIEPVLQHTASSAQDLINDFWLVQIGWT